MCLFHPISLCAPLPSHFQQAVLHHPRSAQCSLLTGLLLPGKPSSSETSRDSAGRERRDGRKGQRCSVGPVLSPEGIRPLALPQHTAPSVTHANKKHTKQQYIYTHRRTDMHTHRNTQAGALERYKQKVRESGKLRTF